MTIFCRVFVNRSLNMAKIKIFGFDMDYTLAGKYIILFFISLELIVYLRCHHYVYIVFVILHFFSLKLLDQMHLGRSVTLVIVMI